ncbi:hypothetical protein CHUAL_010670 [Chamberlinius hualienensis]
MSISTDAFNLASEYCNSNISDLYTSTNNHKECFTRNHLNEQQVQHSMGLFGELNHANGSLDMCISKDCEKCVYLKNHRLNILQQLNKHFLMKEDLNTSSYNVTYSPFISSCLCPNVVPSLSSSSVDLVQVTPQPTPLPAPATQPTPLPAPQSLSTVDYLKVNINVDVADYPPPSSHDDVQSLYLNFKNFIANISSDKNGIRRRTRNLTENEVERKIMGAARTGKTFKKFLKSLTCLRAYNERPLTF